jgi:hypothetical protein
MLPLTRIPSLAAAGALFVLTAASITARADELAQNLGPVGPHEPILTTVGSKRVIAFYEPDSGHCAFHAVVWNTTDVKADSAAGFQADLNPRQMVRIDTAESASLNVRAPAPSRDLLRTPLTNLYPRQNALSSLQFVG